MKDSLEDSLEVIYTHKHGQIIMNMPLDQIMFTFLSKKILKEQLLLFWSVIKNSKELTYTSDNKIDRSTSNGIGELAKISTCIISANMSLPNWYDDWDGKFYFNWE